MYRMNLTMPKTGIDTHFHVFQAGHAVEGARYVPQYAAGLDDWMVQAQSVGVTRGVWVQPSFLGVDNSLMVNALQAHPQVLRGVAVVPPDMEPDELRLLHDSGVRGIRLNLVGLSHDIPEWMHAHRLWQSVHELGWHLEVHTNSGALPSVLAQLPGDMPLVLDHMAKPGTAKASDPTVQALVRRGQHVPTHIKLSGAYRLGDVDASRLAHLWLHELGVQALLWGSDWPCTNHESLADYPSLLSSLQAWVGGEHVEAVLSHNPERLYWKTHPTVAVA